LSSPTRKWEDGEDLIVLEFKAKEYGRSKWVVADEAFAAGIRKRSGIADCGDHSER
jgi:hypothetical protein